MTGPLLSAVVGGVVLLSNAHSAGGEQSEPERGTRATLEVKTKLEGHDDPARHVVFSPDGKYLASSSLDFTARLWDVTDRKLVRTVRLPRPPGGYPFTMDGKLLSAHPIAFPPAGIAFSPDGKVLATGGTELRLWGVPDCNELFRFKHDRVVSTLAFSPGGKQLASGAGFVKWGEDTDDLERARETTEYSGDVILWETATWRQTGVSKTFNRLVESAAFSPDGKALAVAVVRGNKGNVLLLDPHTGKEQGSIEGFKRDASWLAFSPDGKTLAICAYDLCLWDVATQKMRLRIKTNFDFFGGYDVAFSPNGKAVAIVGRVELFGTTVFRLRSCVVKLHDAATGRLLASGSHGRLFPTAVAFSPDGKLLATGGSDPDAGGFVWLWDVEHVLQPDR